MDSHSNELAHACESARLAYTHLALRTLTASIRRDRGVGGDDYTFPPEAFTRWEAYLYADAALALTWEILEEASRRGDIAEEVAHMLEQMKDPVVDLIVMTAQALANPDRFGEETTEEEAGAMALTRSSLGIMYGAARFDDAREGAEALPADFDEACEGLNADLRPVLDFVPYAIRTLVEPIVGRRGLDAALSAIDQRLSGDAHRLEPDEWTHARGVVHTGLIEALREGNPLPLHLAQATTLMAGTWYPPIHATGWEPPIEVRLNAFGMPVVA